MHGTCGRSKQPLAPTADNVKLGENPYRPSLAGQEDETAKIYLKNKVGGIFMYHTFYTCFKYTVVTNTEKNAHFTILAYLPFSLLL